MPVRMFGNSANVTSDAADRTTAIRPRADRGVPLRFLYRGVGQVERLAVGVVAEHATTGGPVCVPGASCVPDPNEIVATTTYTRSTLGLSAEETAGLRTSFAQHAGGTTQYLLADGLGSIVRVNEHTAGTVATYEYDPFGNISDTTGVPAITPFRYAGYYFDATGLYKAGERYYDPAHGRWTQQDPVYDYFDPKLWNRYVYVGNDPINYVDPSGLFSICNNRYIRDVVSFFSILPGGDGRDFPGSLSAAAWVGSKYAQQFLKHHGTDRLRNIVKWAKRGSAASTIAGTIADIGLRTFCR